jgi:hypothetical protein
VDVLMALQAETQAELDALLPAVLDKAFMGGAVIGELARLGRTEPADRPVRAA